MFAAPTLVEEEICDRYGVRVVGRTGEASEHFYALTLERDPSNPGVRRILDGGGGS